MEIINAANADIVALQELPPAAAAVFEAQLREEYPYQALDPQPDYAGQGVLSRFPIVADSYWRYQELPGALGHQRVELQIAERRVMLYNVHPMPPPYLSATSQRGPSSRSIKRSVGKSHPRRASRPAGR